ncbi:MAG: hypothetical protein IKN54_08605 [Lachnospiraceae bacterium]|nr:hypothetical protein [Lachnospiraceae bacterium]
MKKSTNKRIASAMAMLMLSTAMLGTTTYAWFSMNTQVTATGMQVKAQAEGGIVIANSTKTGWTASANAQVTTASLFPTSNAKTPGTLTTWYHNKSDAADNAKAGQEQSTYDTLNIALSDAANGEGVGYVDLNDDSAFTAGTDSAYFLKDKFFIKSSGDALNGTTLYINKVEVTSNGSLLAIDNALRVCVVVDGTSYLYAPVSVGAGPTLTYKVRGSATDTVALAGTVKNTATGVTTIANTNEQAVPVEIYVYFEGEDTNCKSTNISGITTDNITVSVQFGTTTIS